MFQCVEMPDDVRQFMSSYDRDPFYDEVHIDPDGTMWQYCDTDLGDVLPY